LVGTPPAIEFVGISKSFGSVAANRGVDLAITKGSIHGIVGENGAGKSTLMSMLYGTIEPDAGEIRLDGHKVLLRSAADAIGRGIGMVHQHFQLVEPMSVLENLILGMAGSRRRATSETLASLERLGEVYGLGIDPGVIVADLPVGLRQRVEILKLLQRGAEILILDEPTAVLTPAETEQFFTILRRLKSEGKTILLISHKLREIMGICDRVSVLRAGRVVADLAIAETNEAALAELMIGRKPAPISIKDAEAGPVLLSVRGLSATGLGPIDLDLRSGEITGVCGVAGNGQTELLAALAGLLPTTGAYFWQGEPVLMHDRSRRLHALGLAHIPEDRLRMGLVANFAAWESSMLGVERHMAPGLFMPVDAIRGVTRDRMSDWDIRPRDETTRSGRFSGGNQQKLVAAREIARDPAVLLVGQPTRGVDIGAIETIHRRLLALRQAGAALLLVSTELDEILALADRILVMVGGRIVGEMPRAEATEQRLGLLMAGVG
jgi:simple sugar transport system ATP-binding protein